jgi:hypothetical protein
MRDEPEYKRRQVALNYRAAFWVVNWRELTPDERKQVADALRGLRSGRITLTALTE